MRGLIHYDGCCRALTGVTTMKAKTQGRTFGDDIAFLKQHTDTVILTDGTDKAKIAVSPNPGAKPLGPFYELETSSPAAALAPGKSMEHVHRTFHLQGDEPDLDKIARAVLGVSVDEIKKAFSKKGPEKE